MPISGPEPFLNPSRCFVCRDSLFLAICLWRPPAIRKGHHLIFRKWSEYPSDTFLEIGCTPWEGDVYQTAILTISGRTSQRSQNPVGTPRLHLTISGRWIGDVTCPGYTDLHRECVLVCGGASARHGSSASRIWEHSRPPRAGSRSLHSPCAGGVLSSLIL